MKYFIRILLAVVGILFILSLFDSKLTTIVEEKNPTYEKSSDAYSSNKSFTFVLTHLLDTKLTKYAYFSVGDMKVWELDFRNGETINYTIISMNPDNPMCGITARDNFGDTCEICITKTSGDNTKVEFKYNGKRLTYRGYLLR